MHICNKERLKGLIKGAINRKEEGIKELMNRNNTDNFERIAKAEKDLESLLEEEERYWKMRSRED